MDSHPLSQSTGSQPLEARPDVSTVEVDTDGWGARSLGLAPSVAAGLSYLPPVGLVVLWRERVNGFVRFHAAQATLLDAAFVALFILRTAIFAVLDRNQSLAALFLGQGIACVVGLVTLAFVGVWLWGLISGFSGKYTKLPLVGELAEAWGN